MTNQHPITPSLELVQQWSVASQLLHSDESWEYELFIVQRAAQWGADQELEACVQLTRDNDGYDAALGLRAARRPKPPSLKEQALRELGNVYSKGQVDDTTYETIANALEALPND